MRHGDDIRSGRPKIPIEFPIGNFDKKMIGTDWKGKKSDGKFDRKLNPIRKLIGNKIRSDF